MSAVNAVVALTTDFFEEKLKSLNKPNVDGLTNMSIGDLFALADSIGGVETGSSIHPVKLKIQRGVDGDYISVYANADAGTKEGLMQVIRKATILQEVYKQMEGV